MNDLNVDIVTQEVESYVTKISNIFNSDLLKNESMNEREQLTVLGNVVLNLFFSWVDSQAHLCIHQKVLRMQEIISGISTDLIINNALSCSDEHADDHDLHAIVSMVSKVKAELSKEKSTLN